MPYLPVKYPVMLRWLPVFLLIIASVSLGGRMADPVGVGAVCQPPLRSGKDYALFFALESYQHWSPLRHPHDEAEVLAQELRSNYGFQTEIVQDPSDQEIYEKLEEYLQRTYAADAQLLIFFSGHGEFVEDTREGFLIPINAQREDFMQRSYLPHDRFKKWVNTIPCRHILLAIDACYSGTLDDRIAGVRNDKPDFRRPQAGADQGPSPEQIEGFVLDNLQYQTRFYLTSGGKEQTPDRSQFARQMLDGLRSTTRQDPVLTFTELKGHLEKAQPLPRAGEFGYNEPGLRNFLFVRKLNSFPLAKGTSTTTRPPAAEDRRGLFSRKIGGTYPVANWTALSRI